MSRLTPRVAALLTLPPLLWAGNAVVGRLMVGQVPPLALNALRWLLAGLLLLPLGGRVLRDPAQRALLRTRWRPLALQGVLGVGCYNALQYLALTTSTPVTVTLIAASMPLWMMALGALLYRERPRPAQLLGGLLSLAGVLTVLSRGQPAVLAALHFVRGDLLMILAVLAWSLYSWQLARPPARLRGAQRPEWNWAELLLVHTLFGSVFATGCAGIEAVASDATWHVSAGVGLALLYVAVGPSVIAYGSWNRAVGIVGPAVAAFFSNLAPLFTALLSAALLGEPPRAYHLAAFVLIVAGIAVSTRR